MKWWNRETKEDPNPRKTVNTRYLVRLIAVLYLIYLIYQLIQDILSGASEMARWLQILLVSILAVLTVVVAVISIIGYRREIAALNEAEADQNQPDPSEEDPASHREDEL